MHRIAALFLIFLVPLTPILRVFCLYILFLLVFLFGSDCPAARTILVIFPLPILRTLHGLCVDSSMLCIVTSSRIGLAR